MAAHSPLPSAQPSRLHHQAPHPLVAFAETPPKLPPAHAASTAGPTPSPTPAPHRPPSYPRPHARPDGSARATWPGPCRGWRWLVTRAAPVAHGLPLRPVAPVADNCPPGERVRAVPLAHRPSPDIRPAAPGRTLWRPRAPPVRRWPAATHAGHAAPCARPPRPAAPAAAHAQHRVLQVECATPAARACCAGLRPRHQPAA